MIKKNNGGEGKKGNTFSENKKKESKEAVDESYKIKGEKIVTWSCLD